jgi:hypothetical protein
MGVDREENCDSCLWWEPYEGEEENGECHRYAPSPLSLNNNDQEIDDDDNNDIYTSWPMTFSRDWCGEYGLKNERKKQ